MKRISGVMSIFLMIALGGCKNNVQEKHYDDGSIKEIAEYDRDKLNGTRTVYFQSGSVDWEAEYKDGIEHGFFVDYSEDGVIKETGTYLNGKADGTFKKYYNQDQLKSECGYSNGIEDGDFKSYHLNGKIKMKAFFRSGKSQWYKEYDDTGKLIDWTGGIDISNVENDTLKVGESFRTEILFLGPLENETLDFRAVLFVGEKPTLAFLEPEGTKAYYESPVLPSGVHKIKFQVSVNGSTISSSRDIDIVVLP